MLTGSGDHMPTNDDLQALNELFPLGKATHRRVPQIWAGMSLAVWTAFLTRYRASISPRRLPRVLSITFTILLMSPFVLLQRLLFRWRRYQPQAPLLVVGHWRSGTTLLHELLSLDKNLVTPTGYDCFAPHHSLVTAWFVKPLLRRLLPAGRQIDNMALDLSKSQEDEFALLLMGAPSPYESLAFPDARKASLRTNLDNLSPREQRAFDHAAKKFFALMGRNPARRLALKSPAHAVRLARLARLFPGIKVVHLVRDPRAVFPSTLKAVQSLQGLFALGKQETKSSAAEMMASYLSYFDWLEKGRQILAPAQFIEITFEALIADPIATLEEVYRRLDLGAFDAMRQALAAQVPQLRSYKRSASDLEPRQRAAIERHTAHIMRRYGYR